MTGFTDADLLSSVNFGSNKILSNAKLDLAHGRRYGLIGR